MRWRAERDALRSAVDLTRPAAESRNVLPVLNGLRLDAHEDGSLTVCGTDLDLTITTTAKGATEEAGTVIVPAKLLASWLAKAPDGAVEITTDDAGRVTFSAGPSAVTCSTYRPEEWPRIQDHEKRWHGMISLEAWPKLRRLAGFADPDPASTLHGVRFDAKGAWAATGHRACHVAVDGLPEATIPSPALAAVAAAVPEGAISFDVGERMASFSHDDVTWTCRLVEKDYPNIDMLVPTELPLSIDVETVELVAAVDRLSLVSDSKNPPGIVMSFEDDMIRAESSTLDVGEVVEHIDAGLDVGDVSAVKFNGIYLKLIASTFGLDRLTFRGVTSLKPWVVESGNVLVLVMPIRIGV